MIRPASIPWGKKLIQKFCLNLNVSLVETKEDFSFAMLVKDLISYTISIKDQPSAFSKSKVLLALCV